MNNVNLIGRLTKDIELRRTNGGKSVCSFCIAVDGGKDISYFIDCVAWDTRAENIAKFFHKGDQIGIAGLITTRSFEDANGNKRKSTEVLVNSFDFCNGKKETQAADKETQATDDEGADMPFEI